MRVLVTGGAGYIGSHTVVALIKAGHEPHIVDNFNNSKPETLKRLETITGKKMVFSKIDLTDEKKVKELFETYHFDAVIHFAALKAVGESVEKPIMYYRNNLNSLLNVLEGMITSGVKKLIFSSSCTVYGMPDTIPVSENESIKGLNPYGQTKIMGEQIIKDAFRDSGSAVLLRYFNPIGSHESGMIGEDPNDIPNNLLPYVSKVAAGELKEVTIYGGDYDTPDGTGVRDYIHVMDLAEAHVAALNKIEKGVAAYNVGAGKGYSVLDIIKAFEKSSKKHIPYKIGHRRKGDAPLIYADTKLAKKHLGWSAKRDLQAMCDDAWRWQVSISNK